MPQPDPCRQPRVPECLVKADSCGCGTEESRAVKGASWVHGMCMQVLTVWDITFKFLPRPTAQENEPFSTAERSERVENSLFRPMRGYTEAGIEQAIAAMRRLGANSPEPRKRAVRE